MGLAKDGTDEHKVNAADVVDALKSVISSLLCVLYTNVNWP